MKKSHIYSILLALIAAALFGASAPLAKLLLGEIDPILLAALLYLGSGLGILIIKVIQRIGNKPQNTEARIVRSDWIWLAGATIAGGIAAPIIMLFSLKATPAATASLLLNFESVATTLIAILFFKEAVSRRAWWAIITITTASILLSINIKSTWGFSLGAVGIVVACLFWGIDNNLTRNISGKDPLTIVTVKGLAAGTFSLILALVVGNQIPIWGTVFKALLLGSISYGVSIMLFIRALRGLGAARTSALFSTAPISGLALSLILFKEIPHATLFLALSLIAIGTFLLVNEEHIHTHVHEHMVHEHSHNHDDGHHDHSYENEDLINHYHSHIHKHPHLDHKHLHMPDTHHRHSHGSKD